MTPPRLTVCSLTRNSAATLELWAGAVRAYADEIVIAIDASSDDATEAIARRVADRTYLVEHADGDSNAAAANWMFQQAGGGWILHLDDDEFMGPDFAVDLPRLLDSAEITHYYFDRRWLIRQADGRLGWLTQSPWGYDPCLRLFRNIPSIFWHSPEMHTATTVLGAGKVLDQDEAPFYHLDLLWCTRQQRERKVWERYQGACKEYYLFEERFAPESVAPADDRRVIDFAEAMLVARRTPTAVPREESTTTPMASAAVTSTVEMMASARRSSLILADCGVAFLGHDTPRVMARDSAQLAHLTMRNTSDGVWDTGGAPGPIHVSYHWWRNGEEVIHDGVRSWLPQRVAPDDTVVVTAHIVAPPRPGAYFLEWDIVQEPAGWFGQRGGTPLRVEVEVRSLAGDGPCPPAATISTPGRSHGAGAGGGGSESGGGPRHPLRRLRRVVRRLLPSRPPGRG
jgi:hypothetical protein